MNTYIKTISAGNFGQLELQVNAFLAATKDQIADSHIVINALGTVATMVLIMNVIL